jgi:hypothetical protein
MLTLASYVLPETTSGAMYAAVPMLEVLVPVNWSSTAWAESTVSAVAAEKVYRYQRSHRLLLRDLLKVRSRPR